eukprot:TRINITY_DN6370_c0_g1_i7.p1 TRINITY_DN6370_c0_g1~~TRINITY_DN6370_c0_g1_i7.p1  ORF type:complete len:1413 (+),score=235.95 TRINITY_DN6370_c0_g1_i7:176-4414(+)
MSTYNTELLPPDPIVVDGEQTSKINEAITSFLPRYLLNKVSRLPPREHPEAEEFPVALLFADISGFTKLSEILGKQGPFGLEQLTKHLNSYFGSIIEVIDEHGGDVIKIAGDAIMAMWRVSDAPISPQPTPSSKPGLAKRKMKNLASIKLPDLNTSTASYQHDTLAQAALRATKCAIHCLEIHQSYHIEIPNTLSPASSVANASSKTEKISPNQPIRAELKLHCALATGSAFGVYCGGVQGRWEFLLCGDQIYSDIRKTLSVSSAGEIVLTKEAWNWVNMTSSADIQRVHVEVIEQPFPVVKLTIPVESAGLLKSGSLAPLLLSPRDGFASIYTMSAQSLADNPTSLPLLRMKSYLSTLILQKADISLCKNYLPNLVSKSLDSAQTHRLPEHRRCTVLFISIVNMTFNSVGDLDGVQKPFSTIQQVAYSADGFIRQVIVDDKGFVAIVAFGVPGFSHDDDPQRGLESALRIYKALDEQGFQCSIGCTTGRVFCGDVGSIIRREYAMVGDTVNTAAHIMCLKQGVLCDFSTSQTSARNMSFDVVSNITLKGKPYPVDLYRPGIVEASFRHISMMNPTSSVVDMVPSRRLSLQGRQKVAKVYGREKEIETFENLLSELKGSKITRTFTSKLVNTTCKVVFLLGEPGMGKSVILSHLLRKSVSAGYHILSSSTSPLDVMVPLFVWRAILDQALDLKTKLSLPDRDQVIIDLLRSTPYSNGDVEDFSTTLPTEIDIPNLENPCLLLEEFLGLRGMDTTIEKLDAKSHLDILRLLLRHLLNLRSQPRPRLIVLEDMQWMDSLSWSFLMDIVRSADHTILVLTGQPFTSTNIPTEYSQLVMRSSITTVLNLTPLGHEATILLAKDCLNVDSIPAELEKLICERTNGNPLFISELCYSLVYNKTITIENRSCFIPAQLNLMDVSLPNNIEGMIIQRIDQLPGVAGTVLKVASVLGKTFELGDLAYVYPSSIEKDGVLHSLESCVQHKLLTTSMSKPGIYSFILSVIQEVAYGLLLFSQRKKVHRKYAELLESKFKDDVSIHAPVLAHHYARAENVDRAIEFFHIAAYQSMKTGSCKDVIHSVNQGMMLAERFSREIPPLIRVKWQCMMGEALYLLGLGTEAALHFQMVVAGVEFDLAESRFAMLSNVVTDLSRELLRNFCSCHQEHEIGALAERTLHIPHTMTEHTITDNAVAQEMDTPFDMRGDSESSLGRILQNPWESIEGKQRNYFLAYNFEKLALTSFWNGNRVSLLYYIMKMLHYAEEATPGPILIKVYGNLAFASALQGMSTTARKYISQVDRLLRTPSLRKCVRYGIPAGLRSTGLALLSMGDLDSSSGYLLLAFETAIKLNDLRLQTEIATLLAFICIVRGGVVQSISYVNRLSQIASIRSDPQCRCWANALFGEIHLRYGTFNRISILKK